MTKTTLAAFTISIAAAALPASAGLIGQATTLPGQYFTSACSGDNVFDSTPDPGVAFNGGVSGGGANCSSGTSPVGGLTFSTSASSGGTSSFSNSANAIAGAGAIHLSAVNAGTGGVEFPGAAANAGWNDSITWTGPTGTWLAPLQVDGNLSAGGLRSTGSLFVAAYQNFEQLQPYLNAADQTAYDIFLANNAPANGNLAQSWVYQMVGYGVTDYGPQSQNTLLNLTVNETLYFAIPVVTGQTFEFGFFADALAGDTAAVLPDGSVTSTSIDFADTVSWGGPGAVILPDGSTDTNFTIGPSASGFDYNEAAVPEPSSANLLALGSLILGFLLWRVSARRQP